MSAEPAKIHPFEEITKHNQRDDCWLIINGKVYDVTPFMDDHPGGDDVMVSSTGKDATNDFEDVGHSKTARNMLDKYYIGEVDSSTFEATKISNTQPPVNTSNSSNNPGFMIKLLQLLVPIMILGLAVVIRKFTKSE